jgi:hypothetical protein
MFTSNFGRLVEVKDIHKGKVEEGKYMGVCRWESEIVTRMINKLPSIVTMHVNRNSARMKGLHFPVL